MVHTGYDQVGVLYVKALNDYSTLFYGGIAINYLFIHDYEFWISEKYKLKLFKMEPVALATQSRATLFEIRFRSLQNPN
jgi:hypothetical protein